MRDYVQKKLGKVCAVLTRRHVVGRDRFAGLGPASPWPPLWKGLNRSNPDRRTGQLPPPGPTQSNPKQHINQLQVLTKLPLGDAVQRVDVHLSVVVVAHAAKHSHTCEATVFMKGGQVGAWVGAWVVVYMPSCGRSWWVVT